MKKPTNEGMVLEEEGGGGDWLCINVVWTVDGLMDGDDYYDDEFYFSSNFSFVTEHLLFEVESLTNEWMYEELYPCTLYTKCLYSTLGDFMFKKKMMVFSSPMFVRVSLYAAKFNLENDTQENL